MSTLLAIIITTGHLNQTSEITAMRSAGISFHSILKPYFVLGIIISVSMYFHQNRLVPHFFKSMNQTINQIYDYKSTSFITVGIYNLLDSSQGTERFIFVGEKEEKNGEEILKSIQVRTLKDTPKGKKVVQFISAKRAIMIKKKYKKKKPLRALRLYQGYAFFKNPDSSQFQKVDFSKGTFDFHLVGPKQKQSHTGRNFIQEAGNNELIARYKQLKEEKAPAKQSLPFLTELYKRSALPFSSLFFILLGFPMSIVSQRSGKGFGMGLSVVFIFLYFTIFLSTDTIALKWPLLPPLVCAWSANLSIIVFAIYFYRKRLLNQ